MSGNNGLTLWFDAMQVTLRDGRAVLWMVGAVVTAISVFTFCSWFSRFFNRKFERTAWHTLLCGLAGVLGLMSVALWGAASNLETVVKERIDEWTNYLNNAQVEFEGRTVKWESRLFELTRNHLHSLGFAQTTPGKIINHGDTSIDAGTQFQIEKAMDEFGRMNPYLAKVIRFNPPTAQRLIREDMSEFWRLNPKTDYPFPRSHSILSRELYTAALDRLPSFRRKTFFLLGSCTVLAIIAPILLTGLVAFSHIKVGGRPSKVGARTATRLAARTPRGGGVGGTRRPVGSSKSRLRKRF